MPSGVRDIQLLELKDTISQLNNTISTQNGLIRSLQKMLQERDAKDSEKDQLIANLQAQLDYLKTRLFGSTSEIRHEQLPGQLDLFHLQTEDEPEPVPLEVEYIEVKAHKKARKSKAAYDEVFADLPTENVYVDTLTEEQKTCDVCGTMMVPIGHPSGQNCVIQSQSWSVLIIMRLPMSVHNARKRKIPGSSRTKELLH